MVMLVATVVPWHDAGVFAKKVPSLAILQYGSPMIEVDARHKRPYNFSLHFDVPWQRQPLVRRRKSHKFACWTR